MKLINRIILSILKSKPKFRIVMRDNKYYSQELYGFWKIGFYFDFAYPSHLPCSFNEYENRADAEFAIEKRMKHLGHTQYTIKEYYD